MSKEEEERLAKAAERIAKGVFELGSAVRWATTLIVLSFFTLSTILTWLLQ